jgi:hypothetical protein
VISWEAQPRKPARCISCCRVLRDQRHVAEIFKLGNPQAKMDYLETQKKLLLVSKIVDKIRSLAQVEEENLNLKTVEEHKTTGTALFADLEAVYNPNEVSQYTIGVNTDNIKKEQLTMSTCRWYVEVLLLLT